MSQTAKPDRLAAYDAIDVIRACAALAVVWNHAWNMEAGSAEKSASLGLCRHLIYASAGFGQDAVSVFFVISGFWITSSVLNRMEGGRWNWRDYGLDRISRLWIVLVPALIVGGGLDFVGGRLLHLAWYQGAEFHPGQGPLDRLDVSHFIVSLFFLQELVLPPFGSNGPLWSLSYEFWYYVWFPPIALMIWKKKPSWGKLLALGLMMTYGAIYTQLFPVWLSGSLISVVTRRWTATSNGMFQRYCLFCIGFIAFASSEAISHLYNLSLIPGAYMVAFGFSIFALTLIRANLGIACWLRPVGVYGARSSFSLYVVHAPFLAILIALLKPFGTSLAV